MRYFLYTFVTLALGSVEISASEPTPIEERMETLAPERISTIALATKGVVYRFWEIPAREHQSRQPVMLFELRFWNSPTGTFEGEMFAIAGLPDGKVLRETKKADEELILRIGKVLWQTEVLQLPRLAQVYDTILTPGGDVGFHAGAWEIEAFDSWSQQRAVVQRPRFEGTAMGRVNDAFRAEAHELIKKLVKQLPPE